MTIWWCEEHRAAESAEEGICEVAARDLALCEYSRSAHTNTCRIVRMRLISENTLIEEAAQIPTLEDVKSLAASLIEQFSTKGRDAK